MLEIWAELEGGTTFHGDRRVEAFKERGHVLLQELWLPRFAPRPIRCEAYSIQVKVYHDADHDL